MGSRMNPSTSLPVVLTRQMRYLLPDSCSRKRLLSGYHPSVFAIDSRKLHKGIKIVMSNSTMSSSGRLSDEVFLLLLNLLGLIKDPVMTLLISFKSDHIPCLTK